MEGNTIRRFIRRLTRSRRARRKAALTAVSIIAALGILLFSDFGTRPAPRSSGLTETNLSSYSTPLLLQPAPPLRVTDSRRYGSVLGREYSAPFLDGLDWLPARKKPIPIHYGPVIARWQAVETSGLRVVTNTRAIPEPRPSLLLAVGLGLLAWEGRRRQHPR